MNVLGPPEGGGGPENPPNGSAPVKVFLDQSSGGEAIIVIYLLF